MTSPRSDFRALARAALSADTRVASFTMLSAWSGSIMAERLPVIAVVTPQERITPQTFDHFQRGLRLQVVSKRLGGDDLEDELDLDADAIEASVTRHMLENGIQCLPVEVTTTLNGDGEQKIGTAVVTFDLQYLRALPTQD